MIVGTAGHIDHGKTALVGALTGVDTDRLKEEKARGISIDLGFAYLPVPDGGRLGFVDVPGHERFVHTMLAGASGIDFALLVVAADDGPMPQTLEHLAIVDLLGIGQGIVALSKRDLVDADRLARAHAQTRAALAGTALADADIVPVSTRTGEGVAGLRDKLFAAARRHAARASAGLFRLAVDRSFTLAGAGTVVTGTVLSGTVSVGDHVVISPSGKPARIRAIHAQNAPAASGRAGERCALNLAGEGIGTESARRGDVVCDPRLHAPTQRIDAELRWLATERKPAGTWMPVRLHHAATDVAARLVPLAEAPLAPGATGLVQLVLDQPIAAAVGDRYVLRDTSARRTIGGGRFLDLRPPARRRRTAERLAQLAAACRSEPEAALAGLLGVAPFHVDLNAFARDRTLSDEAAGALAERLALVRLAAGDAIVALAPATWRALTAGLAFRLGEFHLRNPDLMGIGQERLRLATEPRLPAPAFRALLRHLAGKGEIALEGAWVRLASHSVQLCEADERRWSAIAGLIGGAERFRPPRVRDLAGLTAQPEADIRRLLKLTSRLGRTDEVAHDHFFLRSTLSEMVDIVVALAAGQTKGDQAKGDQAKGGQAKGDQGKEDQAKEGQAKGGQAKGDQAKGDQAKGDQAKGGQAKGGQAKGGQTKGEFTASQFRDQVHNGRKVAIQILEFFDRHGVTVRRGDLRRINPHRLDLFRVIPAGHDPGSGCGGEASLVGRPDFKSGRGREPVSGGFDSHSPSPLK